MLAARAQSLQGGRGPPGGAPRAPSTLRGASERAKTSQNSGEPIGPPKHNKLLPNIPQAIEALNTIKKDLITQDPSLNALADRLTPVIQALQGHQRAATLTSQLHDICRTIAPPKTPQTPMVSWASVAAKGLTGPPATHIPPRNPRPDAEITIRPNESNQALKEARASKDILKILAPNLARTTPLAARRLRSGDIRLTLKNKAFALKNKGSLQHQINATFLQEVHPVEVLAVPLSLGVQKGPKADNTALLRELSKENGKVTPGIQLTKVHWTRQRPKTPGSPPKARSSLILCTATAQQQHALVRSGVLIEGQFFQARLYDYNQVLDRCFKCSRWGHCQFHCREPTPTCGHCCGPHWTKECTKTDAKACASCKSKSHKSWAGSQCPTYARLRQERQQIRLQTHLKSDAIRDSPAPATFQATYTPLYSETQAGEKRRATPDTEPSRKAGPGRPRLTDPRLRAATQSTLDFGTNPFSPFSQALSQNPQASLETVETLNTTEPTEMEIVQEEEVIPQTQENPWASSSSSGAELTQDNGSKEL